MVSPQGSEFYQHYLTKDDRFKRHICRISQDFKVNFVKAERVPSFLPSQDAVRNASVKAL